MTVTPKEVRKMLLFFVIVRIRLCVCVSLHYFLPPCLQKKTSRLETENRLYMCTFVCMSVTYRHSIYVYIYIYAAHSNTNGISLCCRHSCPSKKKRTRKREKAHRSLFIDRRRSKLTREGKKISAR